MQTSTMVEPQRPARIALSKVPEVTIWFWIIKVLCTTVGETAADYLNVNLNFGLTGTSVVTGALLAVALVLQFTAKRYVPWRYWVTVALVSVFGTLVTDNLTDHLKVRLEVSTIAFSILLAAAFLAWFLADRSLSIHSIRTVRREAFYWLAVLLSFALGTAAGDLMAERLGLGYAVAGEIVVAMIVLTAVLWRVGMNPILSFWVVYVLTRPLGASIGDYMSQPHVDGGLGLGTTRTSYVFFAAILAVVVFLSITKIDTNKSPDEEVALVRHRGGMWQTALYVGAIGIAGIVGYNVRTYNLEHDQTGLDTSAGAPGDSTALTDAATGSTAAGPGATTIATTIASAPVPAGGGGGGASATTATPPTTASSASPPSTFAKPATKLGSLATFRVITQDTLDQLTAGNQSGATKRVDDLEREWDKAEARLKPRDGTTWTMIDGKIDTVLRRLRSTSPDVAAEQQALTDLLAVLR